MLATNDTLLILIGSFGYIIWYLLDYGLVSWPVSRAKAVFLVNILTG